jgi:hypothetical protein
MTTTTTHTDRNARTIETKSGATIHVRNAYRFDIHDQFAIYSGYVVDDTANLDKIIAVLDNPNWTEEQVNAAVEEMEGK